MALFSPQTWRLSSSWLQAGRAEKGNGLAPVWGRVSLHIMSRVDENVTAMGFVRMTEWRQGLVDENCILSLPRALSWGGMRFLFTSSSPFVGSFQAVAASLYFNLALLHHVKRQSNRGQCRC